MGSPLDYFYNKTTENPTAHGANEITVADSSVKVPVHFYQNFEFGSIYLSFYLPPSSTAYTDCISLLSRESISYVLNLQPGIALQEGFYGGPPIRSDSLKFCGRVYIYTDNEFTEKEIRKLESISLQLGIYLKMITPTWAKKRTSIEKPAAFISHDSRDKDDIVRPLAQALIRTPGTMIWFDEFSLKVGDSLREKIEKGLKECKHCVLILSKHFISNSGWTKREFDSVFTREILEKENLILPIWVNVSKEEVYKYSPYLVDRVGLNWNLGIDTVCAGLLSKINEKR